MIQRSSYKKQSPYNNTPQQNQYVMYLDYWQPPLLGFSSDDTTIVLPSKYRHRPDLLSFDAYGTPKLWWVFAVYNSDVLQDPIYDMVPGIEILVPSNTSISGLL
jgi:hypothetical protein